MLQAFGTNKAGVVSRGFFETAKPALKKTTSDGGAAPMAEDSVAAPAQDLNDKGEVVTSAAVRVLRSVRGSCDALPQTDRVLGCGVTQEGGFTPFAGALRGQQRGRGGGSSAAAAVRAGLRRQQSLGPNPQRAGGLLDALGGSTVRPNDVAHEFCVGLAIMC